MSPMELLATKSQAAIAIARFLFVSLISECTHGRFSCKGVSYDLQMKLVD